MSSIADIRAFNRFYTNIIGVVDRHVLNSRLSLAEARILFEIANNPACTQVYLIEQLRVDAGYLSRIIKHFERDGLLVRNRSATDGRTSHLTLTDQGQSLFQTLNQASNQELTALMQGMTDQQVAQLVGSMKTIQTLLGKCTPNITIRHDLRPGDLGLVTQYHGLWYATEFNYDLGFEGYVAKTLSEFAESYAPDKDRLWIAEADGQFIGCIAVVGRPGGVGQLRWFMVDNRFRGQGLGKQLVDLTLDFCRACGYTSVFLLTTADQIAAHALYLRVGFKLAETREPILRWGNRIQEQQYVLTF